MNLKIIETRPATSGEWDAFWKEDANATYFHSREWAELWNHYSEGALVPRPLLIAFSDGQQVLLPFSQQKLTKGLFKQAVSSPAGTYGGWVCGDTLSPEHECRLKDLIRATFLNLFLRVNPFNSLKLDPTTRGVCDDETYTLDLTQGFQAIHERWAKERGAILRHVRKAQSAGVVIRCAGSKADWDSYYDVYARSLQRWGKRVSSKYKKRLFDKLNTFDSCHTKLWLATYEGRVISGALCFYAKKKVHYWHGAALEEFFHLRPVNLLMHEIIKDACEKENSFFDFGTSAGHEGVKAFKKSFGAAALSCPTWELKDGSVILVERLKKAVKFYAKF